MDSGEEGNGHQECDDQGASHGLEPDRSFPRRPGMDPDGGLVGEVLLREEEQYDEQDRERKCRRERGEDAVRQPSGRQGGQYTDDESAGERSRQVAEGSDRGGGIGRDDQQRELDRVQGHDRCEQDTR